MSGNLSAAGSSRTLTGASGYGTQDGISQGKRSSQTRCQADGGRTMRTFSFRIELLGPGMGWNEVLKGEWGGFETSYASARFPTAILRDVCRPINWDQQRYLGNLHPL